MRLIGHLDTETRAHAFGDYLYAQDIENTVEEESGAWTIWVHAEDQLEAAASLLEEFKLAPEDRKYNSAARVAREKRDRAREENEAARKRYFDRSTLFRRRLAQLAPVTFALLGLSVAATLFTAFGTNRLTTLISVVPRTMDGPLFMSRTDAEALLTWQVWRWFTPMLLHLTFLHLLFNMWWLKDLGTVLEQHLGRWRFLGFVLLISGPANVAQYLIVGPGFGGMSGVVYGLLGYIWIRSRLDPFCGLMVDPTTVTIMGIWFVVCLLGVPGLPKAANVVHAVGLGMGLLVGYMTPRRS